MGCAPSSPAADADGSALGKPGLKQEQSAAEAAPSDQTLEKADETTTDTQRSASGINLEASGDAADEPGPNIGIDTVVKSIVQLSRSASNLFANKDDENKEVLSATHEAPSVAAPAVVSARQKREAQHAKAAERPVLSVKTQIPRAGPLPVDMADSRWDELGCTSLKKALGDTVLPDVAWLAELADRGELLPRCQDVPEEQKVTLAEMEGWRYGPNRGDFTVGVLVISYPWLAKNHPDPHGEQLRKIAFVLKAFAREARRHKGCRVGVFLDYCSLPQRHIDGGEDRTDEEQARFQRALRGINEWYGHQKTFVLLVTTPLPTGHSYPNKQRYEGRGWCFAESVMSAMVKDDGALIDLSELNGNEWTLTQIVDHGKGSRRPPIAPDAFHAMLEAGVADGSIRFTNKGDVGVVATIYERAFMGAMTAATLLFYENCGWADEQAATLAAALQYASDHNATAQLTFLNLDNNKISDEGVKALAAAARAGAMAQLDALTMENNRITDEGAKALADAGRAGAFPKLTSLNLRGSPSRTQMRRMASSIFNPARAARAGRSGQAAYNPIAPSNLTGVNDTSEERDRRRLREKGEVWERTTALPRWERASSSTVARASGQWHDGS